MSESQPELMQRTADCHGPDSEKGPLRLLDCVIYSKVSNKTVHRVQYDTPQGDYGILWRFGGQSIFDLVESKHRATEIIGYRHLLGNPSLVRITALSIPIPFIVSSGDSAAVEMSSSSSLKEAPTQLSSSRSRRSSSGSGTSRMGRKKSRRHQKGSSRSATATSVTGSVSQLSEETSVDVPDNSATLASATGSARTTRSSSKIPVLSPHARLLPSPLNYTGSRIPRLSVTSLCTSLTCSTTSETTSSSERKDDHLLTDSRGTRASVPSLLRVSEVSVDEVPTISDTTEDQKLPVNIVAETGDLQVKIAFGASINGVVVPLTATVPGRGTG